ncbi:MAG: beta-ketoacyl-[acyl-carrier-protein] synthase family protein [Planctomycetaceae bacterium]|nr:beta-ketoacyl-[acyl-carrier-protein] synthase family protein [Planctomycetaceae bacterium]
MVSNAKRRVVITGMGLVSPIGIGRDPFLSSLQGGHCGVRKISSYKGAATPGGIGGEVWDFDDTSAKKEYLSEKEQRKALKVMCREIQLGAAAAMLALKDSAIDLDAVDRERFGVEYGANLMFFSPDQLGDAATASLNDQGEFTMDRWGATGLAKMEPLWMLKYLPNMPACHIAIFAQALGPNNSVTVDEASTGVALTEALNIMERGAADVMLVGGTGTRVHPIRTVHGRFWEELGCDEANPESSCRPFDSNRVGQVAAEGAGCLVLEEESHALARGAKIWGRLYGGASSCVGRPDGEIDPHRALVNSIQAALRRSGVSANEVGHYHAHGNGSILGDAAEAAAIREVFGSSVPVTSMKGFTGNPGAGGGFLQIAASLLSLESGHIPYTLNSTNPDPTLGVNLVTGAPQTTNNKLFVAANYTRAGQAAAVVVDAS